MVQNDSNHRDNSLNDGLLESQQLLKALLSNSFDAIIAIDPDKKIAYFNQQAEKLLGYLTLEMVGQQVTQLHADITKAREIYDQIQASGAIEQTNITLVHKNGSKIPVSLSGKRLEDDAGRYLGQVGFFRSTRDVQSLERQLRALIETSKAITSTSDLEKILQRVVGAAIHAIPAGDRGSIHFFDEQSNKLNLMVTGFIYSSGAKKALSFDVDEGIAGWVFTHQQPVNCGNVLADERYKPIEDPEVEAHQSILSVPITGRQRKIGVMSLSSSTTLDAFTQADLDLLIGFADQAAVAIENAEQLRKITKEAGELEFLHEVSLKINAQTEIDDILTAILESGVQLLGVEMAVIHWKSSGKGGIKTFVVPEDLASLRTAPREEVGLTAEVFREGVPVVIPDAINDERVNPDVIELGIKSLVGLPLKLGDQVAGALFFNSRESQHFGEHELHLISMLLPLAAVAIENAVIIERLDRSRHLSESLVEVSSRLAATHDLDDQMATLKMFLRDELAAPMIFLGLTNEVSREIELKINHINRIDEQLFSIPIEAGEDTISSFVVKNKLPLLWFSEQQKQRECRRLGISPLQKGLECRTCLTFPLEVMGSVLGVISIQSNAPHAWNEIEVSTFQTLAHHASLAIRNTRQYDQVNKAHATTRLIAQITTLGDLEYTLKSIVHGVKDVLDCDIVTLYTYREENEQFDFPPAWAGRLKYPAKVVETGIVDRSAAPYRIINLSDLYYSDDSQHDPILGSPFSEREGVCCTVAAPLRAHGKRVGVLFINYCHKHKITEEELDDIRMFSSLAAVAISNAMLYEDEQDRREALRIIDAAGRAVTSSLQLDEVCYELAHQAYDLTGRFGGTLFASISQVEGMQTILMAAHPQEEMDNIIWAKADEVDLDSGVDGSIGIIGRAVKDKAPLLAANVADYPDFIRSNPETKCELAVPIIYQDEVVGVINVEHSQVGGLDEEDVQDLKSLAAHAAVAFNNARMYQDLRRKSQHQQAIYDASKIINVNLTLTQEELLDILVEQMVTRIVPSAGAKSILGAILSYDNEKKELRLESTYPEEAFGPHQAGEVRSMINPPGGKIGITGLTVIKKQPQRVDDVTSVQDYLPYNQSTKSELDVPMLEGQTVLGVLSLECDELNGFDQEAEDALCAFAELAAMAIQNVRRYQELKDAKATVGNITAVAWMGLVAGAWRHSIGNMATTISDLALLASIDLDKGEPGEKIIPRLNKIQDIVSEIQKIPMPPLSAEAAIEPVYITQLIRDRTYQFKTKKDRYEGIEFEMESQIDESAMVRVSSEWMRRILDILIDNAKNAMKTSPVKKISILLSPRDEGVEILISDTGPGIPNAIRKTLFKKPVPKKKREKGSGIGLFLANTIIQAYGGKLEIRSSGHSGTVMCLWLPLQQ